MTNILFHKVFEFYGTVFLFFMFWWRRDITHLTKKSSSEHRSCASKCGSPIGGAPIGPEAVSLWPVSWTEMMLTCDCYSEKGGQKKCFLVGSCWWAEKEEETRRARRTESRNGLIPWDFLPLCSFFWNEKDFRLDSEIRVRVAKDQNHFRANVQDKDRRKAGPRQCFSARSREPKPFCKTYLYCNWNQTVGFQRGLQKRGSRSKCNLAWISYLAWLSQGT